MGIVLPDQLVYDKLKEGENVILSDLDYYLPDILAGRPAKEIERFKQFYLKGVVDISSAEEAQERARYRVKKIRGYPRQTTELPCWAIVIQSENEVRQGIGNFLYEDTDAQKMYYGSYAEGAIGIQCLSNNAELTIHLQAVARYLLLVYRDDLETDGLLKQKVSVSDFLPPPEWFPDVTFVRNITLHCEYELSYSVPYSTISGMTVGSDIDGVSIGDVWRRKDGTEDGAPLSEVE